MPDPDRLIVAARSLAEADNTSDEALRRAVSTGYYAVFHAVARTAVEFFVGPGRERSPEYTILYRGFDHRRMKEVCEALRQPVLRERYRSAMGQMSVNQNMRSFAEAFPALQDARHRADYDPSYAVHQLKALSLIDVASITIETFRRIPAEEKAPVLAMMLVGVRGP